MRRADSLVTTERALTLALVLVAAGYAPTAISPRALAAPAPVHREATETSQAQRVTVEEVELPAPTPAAEPVEPPATLARHTTPYRSVFLSPPSLRGPPALS